MLTRDEVFELIFSGFHSATALYTKWSGGQTIYDAGVESLLCHEVARKFYNHARKKDGHGSVVLEMPFSQVFYWSMDDELMTDTSLDAKSRADVVYFDRNDALTGVIEIKRYIGFDNLFPDACRIASLLRCCYRLNGGTLKFGCVAGIRDIRKAGQRKTAQDLGYDIDCRFRKSDELNGLRFEYRIDDRKARGRRAYFEGEAHDVKGFAVICFYFESDSN